MLIEPAPNPSGVLKKPGMRFGMIILRVAEIRFGRAPDEAMARIVFSKICEAVAITLQDKIHHAAENGQAPLKSVEVARIVVGAGGVFKKNSGIERGFDLILRVIEEIAVGQDVVAEVVLKIRLDFIREIPQLMSPDEFVMGHRKKGMAAHGDFGVSPFANLISGLEAAIAAT